MFDIVEDIVEGRHGDEFSGVAKIFDRSQVGEGGLRAEVANIHGLLRQAAGGDDLAKDADHGLLGKFTVVHLFQTLEDLPLAEGIPLGAVFLAFQTANFLGAEESLFQEEQELIVNGVNPVSDFEEGGAWGVVFGHGMARKLVNLYGMAGPGLVGDRLFRL